MEDSILSYFDDFKTNIGNYIRPDGSFISLNVVHEEFAKNYCRGDSYLQLVELRNKNINEYQKLLLSYSNIFNRDISYNEYITSKLSDEELDLYIIWNSKNKYNSTDFMVRVLGWDKIDSLSSKTIATSSYIPHIRFYNYYLMNWNVNHVDKLVYDNKENDFINFKVDDFSLIKLKDAKYAEEIYEARDDIKKLQLKK